MARVKQTVKVTKTRSGYKKCPNCGGDGRVRKRKA